ncbi:hypothetical protein [Propionibacterium freudenreichii]|uniref:hypothetical protein n=1 Tax=Propionibacterium freudenreichii TaxID=1744 RepID=UPI0021A4D481|nr:hypothetical protein [Propionibacterium freudenreichii]MCT2980597.1 hypothetical protein [Propionibacterium freudenreichii]
MSIALTLTQAATDVVALLPLQVPDPNPVQPPGTEGFTSIMGWAKWVALAVCVLGLIAAGALMAIQSRRGEGGEHVGKIGMALGGVIVISAASALVGFLMS